MLQEWRLRLAQYSQRYRFATSHALRSVRRIVSLRLNYSGTTQLERQQFKRKERTAGIAKAFIHQRLSDAGHFNRSIGIVETLRPVGEQVVPARSKPGYGRYQLAACSDITMTAMTGYVMRIAEFAPTGLLLNREGHSLISTNFAAIDELPPIALPSLMSVKWPSYLRVAQHVVSRSVNKMLTSQRPVNRQSAQIQPSGALPRSGLASRASTDPKKARKPSTLSKVTSASPSYRSASEADRPSSQPS